MLSCDLRSSHWSSKTLCRCLYPSFRFIAWTTGNNSSYNCKNKTTLQIRTRTDRLTKWVVVPKKFRCVQTNEQSIGHRSSPAKPERYPISFEIDWPSGSSRFFEIHVRRPTWCCFSVAMLKEWRPLTRMGIQAKILTIGMRYGSAMIKSKPLPPMLTFISPLFISDLRNTFWSTRKRRNFLFTQHDNLCNATLLYSTDDRRSP